MQKALGWLLVLALSPLAHAQETAYITDILRLGIHRAQDTSDRPFQNLVSGTELTVLERVPNYARVRTADGEEGWVKSAFIVSEKPAQLRVAELEAELAQLRAETEASRATMQAAESEARRITQEMSGKLSAAEAVQGAMAQLQQENAEYQLRFEQYRGAIPWVWVAAALGVALIAGFFGGIWWLDASIRRRYGGFRVY